MMMTMMMMIMRCESCDGVVNLVSAGTGREGREGNGGGRPSSLLTYFADTAAILSIPVNSCPILPQPSPCRPVRRKSDSASEDRGSRSSIRIRMRMRMRMRIEDREVVLSCFRGGT